jgi:hypothetical protein
MERIMDTKDLPQDAVKRKTFNVTPDDLELIEVVMKARKEDSFSFLMRRLIREEAKRISEGSHNDVSPDELRKMIENKLEENMEAIEERIISSVLRKWKKEN